MRFKFYAGIGSRETPPDVLEIMTQIAQELKAPTFILRSGHAFGADQAFQKGAGPGHYQSFLPWNGYNGGEDGYGPFFLGATPESEEIASRFHPAWDKCSQGARKLHARNVMIMTGLDFNTPVEFVVCWTKDGQASGGTGQALRIAEHLAIPIFNLQQQGALERLVAHVRGTSA